MERARIMNGADRTDLSGRPPRLLVAAVLLALFAVPAVLAFHAVQRPLWLDEAMAMANYPLPTLGAFFDPLPRYSQAAPPLANWLMNLIAGLDWTVGRIVLLSTVLGGVGLTLVAAFEAVPGLAALGWCAATLVYLIPLSSEFKYYGLEILGTALLLSWVVLRKPAVPFGARDVLILAAGTSLGVSGLVVASAVVGTMILARLAERPRADRAEILWLGVFGGFLAVYAVLVSHVTRINVDNYFDTYAYVGLAANLAMLKGVVQFAGTHFLPAAVLAALLTVATIRDRVSRHLLVAAVLTLAGFCILSALGRYPASAPRHVAWSGAFYLAFVANGLRVLWLHLPVASRARQGVALVGLAAVGLVSLVPAWRTWRDPQPYVYTDTRRIMAFLEESPPRSVGLWFGAQPMIEAYAAHAPMIGRHRYFGLYEAGSQLLPPEMHDPAFLAQPIEAIAAAIEPTRDAPGAWGRYNIYNIRRDLGAPADALVRQAPKDTAFLIYASHLNTAPGSHPLSAAYDRDLRGALDRAGCAFEVGIEVRLAYILTVTCPSVPPPAS